VRFVAGITLPGAAGINAAGTGSESGYTGDLEAKNCDDGKGDAKNITVIDHFFCSRFLKNTDYGGVR